MGAGRPPGARELEAQRTVRNAAIYERYVSGATYPELAEEFGLSQGLVHKAVSDVAKTYVSEKVEAVRQGQATDQDAEGCNR